MSAGDAIRTLFDRWGALFGYAVASFAAWEFLLLWRRRFAGIDAVEVASNLVSFAIGSALRVLTRGLRIGAFMLVSSLTPLAIETSYASAFVAYLAIDLTLYGWHRVLHETELGCSCSAASRQTGRSHERRPPSRLPRPVHPDPPRRDRGFLRLLLRDEHL